MVITSGMSDRLAETSPSVPIASRTPPPTMKSDASRRSVIVQANAAPGC